MLSAIKAVSLELRRDWEDLESWWMGTGLHCLPHKNGYTHWALTVYLSVNFSSPLWVLIHLILTVTPKREVQLLLQCCIWRTWDSESFKYLSTVTKLWENDWNPGSLTWRFAHNSILLPQYSALYICTQHCCNLWTVHCYWVPLSFLDDM